MYEWARAIITESQADAFIDRDRALALLDAHRDGPHDYSRKIWTLLVFMIWHGIFVEAAHPPRRPRAGVPGAAVDDQASTRCGAISAAASSP